MVLKGDKTPALEAELADFTRCVIEGRAPLVGGAEGLRALRVAERVIASMRKL